MFSVVIPVFQHEAYLSEAVLSAVTSPLVQEVLLLDDGSRDGSAALAKQLGNGSLPKVRDVTPAGRGNRGAHATLNELVAQAACEWIAVLNSDDVFLPMRFDLLRRKLRTDPADLLFGNVTVIDAQGAQLGGKRAMYDPQLPFPAHLDIDALVRHAQWLPLLAHQNYLATTSNMVFRKSLWKRVGGFSDLRYVHDWDFVLRAALEGTVRYVPHALTAYRVHARNTIKEASRKVDAEVRLLFDRLLRDHPGLQQQKLFTDALACNPYLQHREQPFLSLVLPETEGHQVYAEAVRRALSNVEITFSGSHRPPEGQYVYAPTAIAHALHPIHLQNAVLALETQDLDFVLVSHTLAFFPLVGLHSVRDAAVFRQTASTVFSHDIPTRGTVLNGCVPRLFPGGGTVQNVAELLPNVGIVGGSARSETLPTSLHSNASRPVIFVLPALFAVGGVERLVIDMMRQLNDRYHFVVITVERLQERQGALHGPAEGAAIGFYDLAELAPPLLFLSMMERLRDVYRPILVWIPNGSPWQCDNAAGIRAVFAEIPIVDQQAYDTDAGWIARYHEPGIRSYDRFIAINRKIEQTFILKHGISADKIDMIYHSVNLAALGPQERSDDQRRSYRRSHGLPEGKQIFGWVGRFTSQKRPLQFLQFVKAAKSADANRHFLMIGDGELSAACDSYLAEHNLTQVTRIRFSDKMGELFAVMDGLLSASEYEGLPISMLEALAMGVPIYSTDVGDVGLVLEEYRAGSLAPLASALSWDLDQYLNGFERWCGNRIEYRKCAVDAAAQVRVRFGSASVSAQYEKCFRKSMK